MGMVDIFFGDSCETKFFSFSWHQKFSTLLTSTALFARTASDGQSCFASINSTSSKPNPLMQHFSFQSCPLGLHYLDNGCYLYHSLCRTWFTDPFKFIGRRLMVLTLPLAWRISVLQTDFRAWSSERSLLFPEKLRKRFWVFLPNITIS